MAENYDAEIDARRYTTEQIEEMVRIQAENDTADGERPCLIPS